MEHKHLSDKEIQDNLDGNIAMEQSRVLGHLDSCGLCRARLQQYRMLSAALEDDTAFYLPPDFADSIVYKIEKGRAGTLIGHNAGVFLSAIGAAALLAAALYFTDLGRAMAGASWFGWLDSFFRADAFSTVTEYIGSAAHTVGLVVAGMVALGVIWIVDRFMIGSKRCPSSLVI